MIIVLINAFFTLGTLFGGGVIKERFVAPIRYGVLTLSPVEFQECIVLEIFHSLSRKGHLEIIGESTLVKKQKTNAPQCRNFRIVTYTQLHPWTPLNTIKS